MQGGQIALGRLPTIVSALLILGVCPSGAMRAATSEHPVAPGSKIASSDGSCLAFTGLKDVVIEDVTIGPCAGHGIELRDSHNVTIRNVTISDTAQSGIYVIGSTGIRIEESKISNTISGVYILASSAVTVSCNSLKNPRGPIPRGQFVQFDKVHGRDNRISCNFYY